VAETGRRTAKAEETRRALLDGALRLFAEKGYHATSVPDIVQAAGVGHGTFYEYFRSRHDILLALTEPVNRTRRAPKMVPGQSLRDRIRSEIYWYLADHVEHLTLSKVWHQAVHFDADIAETRRRERKRRVERVRMGIEAAGPQPGLDPEVSAAALNAMLEEFAHRWFVEGDGPGTSAADIVNASDTLATIWLSVLGLHDPATAG
jgi:AcrR family transcriptional regulator